jgi:hypothetical protein
MLSQTEERPLLGVIKSDGLESTENDRVCGELTIDIYIHIGEPILR